MQNFMQMPEEALGFIRLVMPNNAHSVDAPIALVFHIAHHWPRATDAQR